MLGKELIILVILTTSGVVRNVWCDDNVKIAASVNAVIDVGSNSNNNNNSNNETSAAATAKNETFPLLEDLVLAEEALGSNDNANKEGDGKNTAKRTIKYHSNKFSGPIVVSDEVNLFTPADEFSRKQINVQIIEPERHNNGQYLKETVYQRQENSTVITSKTTTATTTTEQPFRRKGAITQKTISSKFLAPIQAGLRLSNDAKQKVGNDDDCDNSTEKATIVQSGRRIQENIDIQQNTQIKKVTLESTPKQNLVFGTRFSSTTRPPCDQTLPCSTQRPLRPSSMPHLRPPSSTPLLPPRVATTPTITQIKTTIVPQPIYIHTHTKVPVDRFVDRPVPVEKIVKQLVNVPYPVEKVVPVEVEKLVVKEVKVPVDRIVEKHINHPAKVIEKLVHVPYPVNRPVEVEKVVTKEIQVPVDQIVAKYIDRPVEIEKIVEKQIHVPIDRVVEKIVDRPFEVEKVIEKEVPVQVDHVVEKFVDRPFAVPVQVEKIVEKPVPYLVEKFIDRPIPVEVGVPVHIPYLVHVEVPVHSAVPYPIHVPYLFKAPPSPKQHLIIKTTKYAKGHHGLFDWKQNHHKNVKHVYVKKPNFVSDEIIGQSPTVDSIGLLPPPRFQSYINDNYGPQASASINFVQTVLPNSYGHREHYYGPSPLHNGFGNYNNKLKYTDGFISKDIRWEYGFKPPLIPSIEIDEFGNPIHENT